jgi:hypothetical protein
MDGIDITVETERIEKTIRDCIEWPFPEKNIDRLYSSIAKDPSFFSWKTLSNKNNLA